MIIQTNYKYLVDVLQNLQVILLQNDFRFCGSNLANQQYYPTYIPTYKILALYDDVIVVDNTTKHLYGMNDGVSFIPFQVTYFDGYMIYVDRYDWPRINRDEDFGQLVMEAYEDESNQQKQSLNAFGGPGYAYGMVREKIIVAISLAVKEKIRLDGTDNIPSVYEGAITENGQIEPKIKAIPASMNDPSNQGYITFKRIPETI